MKSVTRFLILTSLLGGVSAPAQVVLQDFSITLDPNTFFYGTWEASGNPAGTTSPNGHFVQGAGVFDFTGTSIIVPTNEAGSKVEFFNVPALGTNTYLAVSAQAFASNLATSFTVTLFDDGGRLALSAFSTMDFVTGTYTTITVPLIFDPGFNSAVIDSMTISGNVPLGSDRFNVSFADISAVSAIPEPSPTAALAGALALGVAVWRRHAAKRTVVLASRGHCAERNSSFPG